MFVLPYCNQTSLIARDILCKPVRMCAANIGSPIGLTRNAMVRRIRPFFTEYVTSTKMPRMPTIPLASRRKNAENEISPMQTSVNRSMARVTGQIWQKCFLPVYLFHRSSSFFFVRSTTAD